MDDYNKAKLLEELNSLKGKCSKVLKDLGIPRSTYYSWKQKYKKNGIAGLKRKRSESRKVWNRLRTFESDRILEVARHHPELSCRLIAVKIIDEEDFSVSISTVYRLLKKAGLIFPNPIPDLPAAKEWCHKTKKPDEIWQSDASHYFVVGWGYYKQITVLDDFSRNPIAWDLRSDETGFSISEIVELAIENAKDLGHLQDGHRPKFLSDNGSGFTSKVLASYLGMHGIKHIFGRPYHPQTQGKIERFHRSIKEKVLLMVYCSPEELKKALGEAIENYANLPHTALNNVSPKNVYLGKREEILKKRQEKKLLTFKLRKLYNLSKKK